MATRVGAKGQVVIDQPIREQLGVMPGMLAVQTVVDDSVVIRFFPAAHEHSLAGALRPHVKHWPRDDEERQRLEAAAWEEDVVDRYGIESHQGST